MRKLVVTNVISLGGSVVVSGGTPAFTTALRAPLRHAAVEAAGGRCVCAGAVRHRDEGGGRPRDLNPRERTERNCTFAAYFASEFIEDQPEVPERFVRALDYAQQHSTRGAGRGWTNAPERQTRAEDQPPT